MSKYFFSIGVVTLLLGACAQTYVQNPDPNHTHADFAVWVSGEQMDFSASELMSGLSTDETTHDEADEVHHKYLHLHDANGNVLHSHKPGLTLKEFFTSLQLGIEEKCYVSFEPLADGQICGDTPFRMFVANKSTGMQRTEMPFDLAYAFADADMVLITNAATDEQLNKEWDLMTDDACLYSRTCPWRGNPPVENCIADPAVPCVEVE